MPSGLFNWRFLSNICQTRIWFIIGRRYASVLPHPVSAVKSVLYPPRIVGIPSFWKCNTKTVTTTFRNYMTQINICTFLNTSFLNPTAYTIILRIQAHEYRKYAMKLNTYIHLKQWPTWYTTSSSSSYSTTTLSVWPWLPYGFWTIQISGVGLSAPCPPPAIMEDRWFSVGVVSLSWPVPILKRREIAFRPYMT
jgi:hypothetical protein